MHPLARGFKAALGAQAEGSYDGERHRFKPIAYEIFPPAVG